MRCSAPYSWLQRCDFGSIAVLFYVEAALPTLDFLTCWYCHDADKTSEVAAIHFLSLASLGILPYLPRFHRRKLYPFVVLAFISWRPPICFIIFLVLRSSTRWWNLRLVRQARIYPFVLIIGEGQSTIYQIAFEWEAFFLFHVTCSN